MRALGLNQITGTTDFQSGITAGDLRPAKWGLGVSLHGSDPEHSFPLRVRGELYVRDGSSMAGDIERDGTR